MEDKSIQDKQTNAGDMPYELRQKYFPREKRVEILEKFAGQYQEQIMAAHIANAQYERALKYDALLAETDPKSNDLLRKGERARLERRITENNNTIIANYEALRVIADMQISLISEENYEEDVKAGKIKKVAKKAK